MSIPYIMYRAMIIGRAKRAPHGGVQSRFCVIYIDIYMSVCMSTVCQNTFMLKISFGRLKPTGDTGVIHFDYILEQLEHGLKRNVHLVMRNL